jgi:HD-GYP domain-containing protein (c-di-GMP phosphodiesterase class II)
MDTDTALPLVHVDALRVGMFVELELGWMAHPFPRSSFRITSQGQIDTLRDLGLAQVRWCPERSAPPAAPVDGPAVAPDAAAPQPTPPAADDARQRARRELAAERAALLRCERRFAESARALRAANEAALVQPQRAGEQASAITRALVDDVLGAPELNIRLLVQASGDRAAVHSLNVAVVALLIGRNFGLDDAEMMDLGVGALMHDVGKLDLPQRLRARDEHFSPVELDCWREHVALGVARGRLMSLSPGALDVLAQHHEQADGRGFPHGLNIDRMSAAARIVALVDRFDNLCNPALPAKALTPHEALSLMFAQCQQQFDTTMLSAFIRMMGVYPPGSCVQLTDDRFALVVSVNSTRPLKPRLRVHDAHDADEEPPLLDLETMPGLGIRRSLKPVQLPPAALRQLRPQPRVLFGYDPAATPAPDAA